MRKFFSIPIILALMVAGWFVVGFYTNNAPQQENLSADVAFGATWRTNWQLISRCVYGEARGEPYEGQVAVAAVILNRVKHPSFPSTIAGVIYQPGAFTAVSDGQINIPVNKYSTVYQATLDAMNGWDPVYGAIYYYNPATTTNRWIWSRPVVRRIGNHIFAR